MDTLRASTFILPEPSRMMHARALWAEMANDVAHQSNDRYEFVGTWGYRVCLKTEAFSSPDRMLVRYRTMEASLRRRSGRPTLLDLSVGNLFSNATASPPEPLHVVNEVRYAQWARHAGQVSLADHVRLVRQFTADVMDAGWRLENAALRPIKIPPPAIRNGRGVQYLPTEKFYLLAQYPAKMADTGLAFTVVWPESSKAAWAAAQLEASLDRMLRVSRPQVPRVLQARRMSAETMNLVLLDDQEDLADLPNLREELRAAEAAGIRFKLAKMGSLSKAYPAQNIAYDMFQIAGGRHWMPAEPQPAFCSMDAGHDKAGNKSRWVKVETDGQQAIRKVSVFDTCLAEHLPAALVDVMWPSEPTAIACRDGRFSQERSVMEARAAMECRPLIEAKKSPRAILWHASGNGELPAQFGDAVIDDHDEVLLQTVPQDPRDYIHPVRLALQGEDAIQLTTAFLHQHAIPGLSLFRMSRLPGALYFADLVSKLTTDGWPKAVGRGFNIPQVIP
jgi:hypothetical protein